MSLSDSFQKLNNFDLSELSNFENAGTWPVVVKIFIALIVLAMVLFIGYTFQLSQLEKQLQRAVSQEASLKRDFEVKAFKVANLGAYKQQMTEMEESFGTLLRQLPSDTEVPGLLEDITQTGLGSGLEFKSIKLLPERKAEFYVELPIEIRVVGGYHEIGAFVSSLASLPRIVTLHDFVIKQGKLPGALEMIITAKTYRYTEKDEV